MSTKKTYISYLRQSTQKQKQSGLGLEAQREIIANHVKQCVILSEYIETESGKRSDRPQLMKALEQCRMSNSTLIVAKLDRLSRNVAFTSRLLESNVEITFCDFPEANRLILHIISSISEYEATLISIRTRQALKAKKERGCKLGKPNNLLNNHEKAIASSVETNKRKAQENENNRRALALIEMMIKEGNTPSKMVKQLNKQGFKTSKGKGFTATQVLRLIKRSSLQIEKQT